MPNGVICGGAVEGSYQAGEIVTCQAITALPAGAGAHREAQTKSVSTAHSNLGLLHTVNVPVRIIHGRFDLSGPSDVAWLLSKAWPDAEYHLVSTGHQGGDEMTKLMLEALNRFGRRG